MTARAPLSNPDVRFPPPILFVAGFGVGWLLDRRVRALPFPGVSASVIEPIGLALLIAGFGLTAWGLMTFRRAKTAIIPNQSASRLVETGPYRFTRNPMYTGLTIASIGGALAIDSMWPLIMLPLVVFLLVRLVVRREEAYLSDAFGDEYAAYCRRVRRWG